MIPNYDILCLQHHQAGFPCSKSSMVSSLEQGEPWIPDPGSKEERLPRGSHTEDRRMPADLSLSRREKQLGGPGSQGLKMRRWQVCTGAMKRPELSSQFSVSLSFMRLSGNCHPEQPSVRGCGRAPGSLGSSGPWSSVGPSSKVSRRTIEKSKSGHPPETCPFFEEMEALMSAQVIALPSNGLEEAASHSGLGAVMLRPRSQSKENWHEEGEEATAEESDSDEVGQEATPQDLTAPPPVLSVAQVVSFLLGILGLD